MKRSWKVILLLLLLIGMRFQGIQSAAAASELEEFMRRFEPDYEIPYFEFAGGMDTKNEFAQPVRLMQTTGKGVVLMIDRVLVTEDDLTVSVLMGYDPKREDWIHPDNFRLGLAGLELSPILSYTEPFAVHEGGGGGEGFALNILNEEPFVVVDTIASPMMFYDGYVSAKEPIKVKIKILYYEVCWESKSEGGFYGTDCFKETGPWEFEFETDGSALAEKTRDYELNRSVVVDGRTLELTRLRFNPMQPILFTDESSNEDSQGWGRTIACFLETDDGTVFQLNRHHFPYYGYTSKVAKSAWAKALETTETLTLKFCVTKPITSAADFPEDFDMNNPKFYTCDPAKSTVIDLE